MRDIRFLFAYSNFPNRAMQAKNAPASGSRTRTKESPLVFGLESLRLKRSWMQCVFSQRGALGYNLLPCKSFGRHYVLRLRLPGGGFNFTPERVVPKGHFVRPDTFGARVFRGEIAILGTFAVLSGTWGAVFSLLSLLNLHSSLLSWITQLTGIAGGILAAIYVRKEVTTRPPYVSNTPYGWWP
jgi:hypothetical protein